MPGPERAEGGMDESDAGLLAATARGDAAEADAVDAAIDAARLAPG
jgi:hypothetical protein